ncbi:hypothetical protein KC330_g5914 [Hortaea werneckii]|nr:hypothetical protein KC330_g5914 [Hortaea werneckii]
MKYTAIVAASGLPTLASAQQGLTYNENNGTYTCAVPNGAYCAGENTNIIIRCTDGVGQPGNCNDNLAGYPPVGVQPALCVSCGLGQGIAACSKDGTVYGASGAGFGNITFPTNSSENACSNAASNGGSSGTTSMAPYMNGTATAGSGSGAMGTAAPSGGYGSGSGSGSSGNNTSGTTPYTGGVSGLQATGTFAGLGALFVAMGLM